MANETFLNHILEHSEKKIQMIFKLNFIITISRLVKMIHLEICY